MQIVSILCRSFMALQFFSLDDLGTRATQAQSTNDGARAQLAGWVKTRIPWVTWKVFRYMVDPGSRF